MHCVLCLDTCSFKVLLNKYAIINGVFHNFEMENSHHWWTKLEGLIIKCGKGSLKGSVKSTQ